MQLLLMMFQAAVASYLGYNEKLSGKFCDYKFCKDLFVSFKCILLYSVISNRNYQRITDQCQFFQASPLIIIIRKRAIQ